MATPTQAAAATVGAGSLAAAGAYGITQVIKGNNVDSDTEKILNQISIPNVITFTDKETFNNTTYNNKLITLLKTSNLPYLVKATYENNKWWEWAFKNKFPKDKQNNTLNTLFSDVDNFEKLKNACKNAYSQEKDQYKFDNNHHLLENISDYCTKGYTSFDISEPKSKTYETAQTTSEYQNGVLSITNNALILVDKNNTNDNKYWWIWAYEKLYKSNNSNLDTLFETSKVTEGFKDSGTTSLNQACHKAYKKSYSDLITESYKLLKNIKQYCSVERTNLSLKLPQPVVGDGGLLESKNSSYSSYELVKINDKKLVDPQKATEWWRWVFDNVFSPFRSKTPTALKTTPFIDSKITSGYSDISNVANVGEINSLNKACLEAYKKLKEELVKVSENNSLINLIQKFCVPSSKEALKEPT